MSGSNVIYSGNTFGIVVDVFTNGVAQSINVGSTVQAALIDQANVKIAGPWTCTSGLSGANWATGRVVVPVAGADTTAAMVGRTQPYPNCRLELKISFGGEILTRRTKERYQLEQAAF